MRGSISIWIWIIGGVLAGFLIFTMAYSQLFSVSTKVTEQRTIEQCVNLKNEINDLCWSFRGSSKNFDIVIPSDLVYLYATDNPPHDED